ncbi:arabinogalactan protein 23-like [Magnolia sinica]|uniref:arabinogalactan protein 23-like n=1 Tax=Magnolia sinica TaxID=86752 RepID=UPI0026590475|nr:arabinogalactan protein 23-like [Magnolia sinica]
MDMRKISCAVIIAAASATAVLAAEENLAPAPGPAMHSGSAMVAPTLGLVGASILSFFAFYMQ